MKTKTIIKKKTVTAKKAAKRALVSDELHTTLTDSTADERSTPLSEQSFEETENHHLEARHLCPRCPTGITVLAASSKNNGGSYSYCCPARKTTTIKRTRTTTRFVTVTTTPVSKRESSELQFPTQYGLKFMSFPPMPVGSQRATIVGRVWYGELSDNSHL